MDQKHTQNLQKWIIHVSKDHFSKVEVFNYASKLYQPCQKLVCIIERKWKPLNSYLPSLQITAFSSLKAAALRTVWKTTFFLRFLQAHNSVLRRATELKFCVNVQGTNRLLWCQNRRKNIVFQTVCNPKKSYKSKPHLKSFFRCHNKSWILLSWSLTLNLLHWHFAAAVILDICVVIRHPKELTKMHAFVRAQHSATCWGSKCSQNSLDPQRKFEN